MTKQLFYKVIRPLLICMLLFSLVLCGCSAGSSDSQSLFVNSSYDYADFSDANYISLNSGFTNVIVTDEASAIQAVATVADMLGISNVNEELQVDNVTNVGDNTFYKMQQYYNGIPVLGKSVNMGVDEQGNAMLLTSNTLKIANVENLNASLSQNELQQSINTYFDDYLGYVPNDPIPALSDCTLYIYEDVSENDEVNFRLVYEVFVSLYSFIVDAVSGEVVDCFSLIVEDREADCFNSDGSKQFDGYYVDNNSAYYAYDSGRNIYIYNYNKQNSEDNLFAYEEVYSDDAYFGNTSAETDLSYNNVADYSINISRIYDFYKNAFGEVAYGTLYACFNDAYDSGENALGGSCYSANDGLVGYISMGYDMGVNAIDTMAHEYTHVVSRNHVNWVSITPWSSKTDQPGAINEALSDIFGEIIQGKLSGSNPDWEHGSRIISDPMSNNYPAKLGDKEFEKFYSDEGEMWGMHTGGNSYTDYSHGFSTIISHCAYSMWNGIDGTENKKIDLDMLAEIWYRAMLLMPSNATFNQCADIVYKAATTVKDISNEELQCVSEAFEQAGLTVSKSPQASVARGSYLYVKDTNFEDYDNYHLEIIPMESMDSQTPIISEDITVSTGYELDLDPGAYSIKVTDNAPDSSGSEFYQAVNIVEFGRYDDTSSITIYTDFGSVMIDDFTLPDSMTLTLGEVNVVEPQFFPNDISGYSLSWISSDESIVSVVPTGETGIVTAKSKGTATITASLNTGSTIIEKTTDIRVATQGRDTVLVLDISGSMYGEPMTEMQESAIDFCNELLADDFNNRVGIVLYDTYIETIDLTNDLTSLVDYITGISSGGVTNMQGGLAAAEEMLDTQGADGSIKNVVIMADGLPNDGETSDTGPMSSQNGTSYYGSSDVAYANAVINTAENIMGKYNMYSLGFFHDLSGTTLDFAVDLMQRLTNMPDGYHQVEQAENLQFAFGDIQENISDGSKIVINIACPVDVRIVYNGEELNSSQNAFSSETSFGTLQLLGEAQDIKVVSLDPGIDYEVELAGTDTGSMNYTINYLNEDESIADSRTFESVPITATTLIYSNTDNSASTVDLNIDENGDGTVDYIWSAPINGTGSLTYGEQPVIEETSVEEAEPVSDSGNDEWLTVMIALIVVLVFAGGALAIVFLTSASKKKSATLDIPPSTLSAHTGKITVLSGSMANREFTVQENKNYIVGKSNANVDIVLTNDYAKVSRKHCIISFDSNSQSYFITDTSSNGTYYIPRETVDLTNETSGAKKLQNEVCTKMPAGSVLILGDDDCKLLLN